MRKIPTIYQRDPATNLRHVKNERHPDCGWVFDGEGVATYKWDGTAVLIDDAGQMWKRREVKPGKPIPDGFRQEGDVDPNTGKLVGWVRCDRGNPDDRWHFEAFYIVDADMPEYRLEPGTYKLVGPKVQGNPHRLDVHELVRHGDCELNRPVPPVDSFDGLAEFLHRKRDDDEGFEGIVWHHPDGRMAKIKVKDFPASEVA